MATLKRVQLTGPLVGLAALLSCLGCDSPLLGPYPGAAERLWKIRAATGVPKDPGFGDGTVYFGGVDGSVLAVEGATGKTVWKITLPGPLGIGGGNIAVGGTTVAVGAADVVGLDRATGQVKWTFSGDAGDSPGTFRIASDGSTFFVASTIGRVYALDQATGATRWKTDLSGGQSEFHSYDPTVSGGELYVGTKRFADANAGALVALSATTGQVRWRHIFAPEFPGLFSGCFGGAAVIGSLVVAAEEDGRIFAFERSTGTVRWIAPAVIPTPSLGLRTNDARQLAVAGGNVVATSLNGTVVLLDGATGKERWRVRHTIASGIAPPAVDDTYAYVSHAGVFVAYSLSSGRLAWREPEVEGGDNDLVGTAIIDGPRFYAAGYSGFFGFRR